jgi:hypothetical protein
VLSYPSLIRIVKGGRFDEGRVMAGVPWGGGRGLVNLCLGKNSKTFSPRDSPLVFVGSGPGFSLT